MTAMTTVDRRARIESYGRAADELEAALRELPRAAWTWRPAAGLWTVHEIVVHLADSEANSYVRCRRFIAEPGQDLMAYDENRWARALDYHAQSADEAVALFKALRRSSYHLIRTLPEAAWAHSAFHPENGTMTLDGWLDVYERHVRDHVAQMRQVVDAWRDAQPERSA
jgi:hypothetical protein